MTDAQMVTLAVAILAVFAGTLFNNSRIADVGKRFDDVGKRFDDVNRHIDDKFALLSQQMKNMEDNLMRILGDHETRIQKLERPGSTRDRPLPIRPRGLGVDPFAGRQGTDTPRQCAPGSPRVRHKVAEVRRACR